MRVALIYADPETHFSARLTCWFTGSNCYHVAFVSDCGDWMWDMHKLMRRDRWATRSTQRYPAAQVILVSLNTRHTIHPAYLDEAIIQRVTLFCRDSGRLSAWLRLFYGWRDYLGFALRPLYHLMGKSTRNYGGEICSEMVANVAIEHGWVPPPDWPQDGVPSPADWCRALGAPLILPIA